VAAPASASLTTFKSFTGEIGYSSDGWGGLNQNGVISVSAPVGATVLGAYLYTATFSNPTHAGVGATLNGTAVAFGAPVVNADACCGIASARADVTSIVAGVVNGGPGGVYNFALHENSSNQDGEALVVIYSKPGLALASFGLLDGFARTLGDTTSVNFAEALHPGNPGFSAEMVLGIGFSCCSSQFSTVKVNGTTITERAGNKDDGVDGNSNGNLITVGGFDDPYSTLLPTYENDHERYNLLAQIADGDTSIKIDTFNTSHDDNIFMAGFYVTGIAGFNEPPPVPGIPEPGTYALMFAGLGVLGFVARRRRS
jgi:hypothetical protein